MLKRCTKGETVPNVQDIDRVQGIITKTMNTNIYKVRNNLKNHNTNPQAKLSTRCPDKVLSLENQSTPPKSVGRNGVSGNWTCCIYVFL